MQRITATVYYAGVGAIAIALGLLSTIYIAEPADAGSWTGCYVGAGGQYAIASSDTSFDVPGIGSVIGVDGLSAQGEGLFGTVGCDLQLPNSKFVLGAFADYAWHNDTTFSVYAMPFGTVLETSLDNSWTVGARAGYAVSDMTLLYILAGYSQAQVSDITSPLAPGFGLSVPDLEGWVFGGGAEVGLGRNLFLQVDGRYADYDKVNVDLFGVPGAPTLGLDTDVLTARVGLLYRFGGSEVERITGAPLK